MPNSAVVYSGVYEVDRLRRRRDRRVQEYIQRRSRRFYRPPPPITMCRITKFVVYLIIFVGLLAVVTGIMVVLVMHFRIPPDRPAVTKVPGLCTVPGTLVGGEKRIEWGVSLLKEIGAFRREIERHLDPFGVIGEIRMTGCNTDLFWGYATGRPCILLKLTNTLGFKPITYDSALELPEHAPDDLFYYVISRPRDLRTNRIWVSCSVRDSDIKVNINYIPHRFFKINELSTQTASFSNHDHGEEDHPALSRFIGVQVSEIPPNHDVFFHCQVWAKNIPLDMASAKFRMRLMAPVSKKVQILDEWEG
ncbi:uncharacterized protein [Drosophila kikkawai]|uniref:Uncharacterized protein n=1 Tax=Drosophila kikkawai TaxID=30033 RepID=A0A6P4J3K4_DROKI|nr:uncharacterized protein LOC108084332 [Drosophila kikkawai]